MRVKTFIICLMCFVIALGAFALTIMQNNIVWMSIPISAITFANTEVILDNITEIKESMKP